MRTAFCILLDPQFRPPLKTHLDTMFCAHGTVYEGITETTDSWKGSHIFPGQVVSQVSRMSLSLSPCLVYTHLNPQTL